MEIEATGKDVTSSNIMDSLDPDVKQKLSYLVHQSLKEVVVPDLLLDLTPIVENILNDVTPVIVQSTIDAYAKRRRRSKSNNSSKSSKSSREQKKSKLSTSSRGTKYSTVVGSEFTKFRLKYREFLDERLDLRNKKYDDVKRYSLDLHHFEQFLSNAPIYVPKEFRSDSYPAQTEEELRVVREFEEHRLRSECQILRMRLCRLEGEITGVDEEVCQRIFIVYDF